MRFSDIIGYNTGLKEEVYLATRVANSSIGVMLRGESGVGKELLAKAIHSESNRVGKPFIAINCSAIPHDLFESILFGHEKGAFTGAIEKSIGKFREANGGTLFLDEVGELAPEVQSKLLRALQESEIEPIGLGKPIKIDTRIICATNQDLKRKIKAKEFREDLFFRLNTFPIQIKSLSERKDDIEPLAQHFCYKFSKLSEFPLPKIEFDAMEELKAHDWPGNVRELENVIYRSAILSSNGMITSKDIGLRTSHCLTIAKEEQINLHNELGDLKKLSDIEIEVIDLLLKKFNNSVTTVAKHLGIGEATIYRKIKTT